MNKDKKELAKNKDWRYQDEIMEDAKEKKVKQTKKLIVAGLVVFLVVYVAYMFYDFFLADDIKNMIKVQAERKAKKELETTTEYEEESETIAYEEVLATQANKEEEKELWVTVSEEDRIKRGYEFLDAIEPVEVSGHFYYYDPEDVKKLNHNCSGEHINLTVDEFEEYIINALPGAEFSEGSTKTDYNYYINSDTSMQRVVFDTRYFVKNLGQYSKGYTGDLAISLQADTSTGQIHYIEFSFAAADENYKIFSEWINSLNPGEVSVESVAKAVTKAQQQEKGYPYYKCEGDFLIEYYVSGDYVMTKVYPIERKADIEPHYEVDE